MRPCIKVDFSKEKYCKHNGVIYRILTCYNNTNTISTASICLAMGEVEKCTSKEIEKYLTQQANNLGILKGCFIKEKKSLTNYFVTSDEFEYYKEHDSLHVKTNHSNTLCIYRDGEFIVDVINKITLNVSKINILTINDTFLIDGKHYSIFEIKDMYSCLQKFEADYIQSKRGTRFYAVDLEQIIKYNEQKEYTK